MIRHLRHFDFDMDSISNVMERIRLAFYFNDAAKGDAYAKVYRDLALMDISDEERMEKTFKYRSNTENHQLHLIAPLKAMEKAMSATIKARSRDPHINQNEFLAKFLSQRPDVVVMKKTTVNSEGQLTGLQFERHETGILKTFTTYKDGLKEGVSGKFREYGYPEMLGSYRQDKLNGTYVTFDEKARKLEKLHYIDGEMDGHQVSWGYEPRSGRSSDDYGKFYSFLKSSFDVVDGQKNGWRIDNLKIEETIAAINCDWADIDIDGALYINGKEIKLKKAALAKNISVPEYSDRLPGKIEGALNKIPAFMKREYEKAQIELQARKLERSMMKGLE